MTQQNNDLPVNPPGISFEDWAALLTGTSAAPGPGSAGPDADSAAAPPPSAPTASSPADALEASWQESLRQEAQRASENAQPPVPAADVEPVFESRRARRAELPADDILNAFTDGLIDDRAGADDAARGLPTVPDFAKTAPIDGGIFPTEPFAEPAFAAPLPPSAPVAPAAAPVEADATAELLALLAGEEPASSDAVTEVIAVTPTGPAAPTPAVAAAPVPTPPAPEQARPAPTAVLPVQAEDDEPGFDTSGADRDLIHALTEVVLQGASDLHVTAFTAPTIRIHGGLSQLPGDAWGSAKVKEAIYSIMSPAQKQKFERELELDFAYAISANARFRVNIYQQRENVGAAFRLIPTELKTLDQLGIPTTVARFATLARGLVLVTGPTGSGKSTTLAALIDLVNSTRADHIVTVEDPIEFMHNHKRSLVNQREVGHDTHSFAAALKHVLRQDPDVILVGELRDLETISVALTAAETGHLVFATLHTQSAAQTIDRIIDVYPPHQQNQVRAQLAATLQGVVTQTLVKKASGVGRAVATEVLVITPAVSNLIREGKTYQIASAMQAGRDNGMHTMDQHLADLVDSGEITHQAGLEKSIDAESFTRLVQRTDTSSAPSGYDLGDPLNEKGW